MIALILAGHLLQADVPPPEPQGLDLLWSQAVAFDHDGMPMIPVGITEHKTALEVILHRPATLILGQDKPQHKSLKAGSRVVFVMRNSSPARVG